METCCCHNVTSIPGINAGCQYVIYYLTATSTKSGIL